jgi:hypothetical protein
MAFAFEKLAVYQKSVDFADNVAALTQAFPRGFGFLADQLNRAALSIATNPAEGITGATGFEELRGHERRSSAFRDGCKPLIVIAKRLVSRARGRFSSSNGCPGCSQLRSPAPGIL